MFFVFKASVANIAIAFHFTITNFAAFASVERGSGFTTTAINLLVVVWDVGITKQALQI